MTLPDIYPSNKEAPDDAVFVGHGSGWLPMKSAMWMRADAHKWLWATDQLEVRARVRDELHGKSLSCSCKLKDEYEKHYSSCIATDFLHIANEAEFLQEAIDVWSGAKGAMKQFAEISITQALRRRKPLKELKSHGIDPTLMFGIFTTALKMAIPSMDEKIWILELVGDDAFDLCDSAEDAKSPYIKIPFELLNKMSMHSMTEKMFEWGQKRHSEKISK